MENFKTFMNELNVYQVFKFGNEFVMSSRFKKPCLRKCISLARNKNTYVELWYVHGNGSRSLVQYWN